MFCLHPAPVYYADLVCCSSCGIPIWAPVPMTFGSIHSVLFYWRRRFDFLTSTWSSLTVIYLFIFKSFNPFHCFKLWHFHVFITMLALISATLSYWTDSEFRFSISQPAPVISLGIYIWMHGHRVSCSPTVLLLVFNLWIRTLISNTPQWILGTLNMHLRVFVLYCLKCLQDHTRL